MQRRHLGDTSDLREREKEEGEWMAVEKAGVGVPLEVEAGGLVICLATVAQKEQTKIRDPEKLP